MAVEAGNRTALQLPAAGSAKHHLTATDIYGTIKKRFPAISLATVYTIVERYKTKGLVQEIRVDAHRSRFELAQTPHHHFVCRMCQRIMDIELAPCPALLHKEVAGHKIEELHGYFFGICRQCSRSEQRRAGAGPDSSQHTTGESA